VIRLAQKVIRLAHVGQVVEGVGQVLSKFSLEPRTGFILTVHLRRESAMSTAPPAASLSDTRTGCYCAIRVDHPPEVSRRSLKSGRSVGFLLRRPRAPLGSFGDRPPQTRSDPARGPRRHRPAALSGRKCSKLVSGSFGEAAPQRRSPTSPTHPPQAAIGF